MDVRALRYFIEVVRQQSFTRAADALFVTQPTISKMVRQLEDELGSPLILREGRSFRLTDAGRVTHERGLDVLAAMNRLRTELADLSALVQGELVVGVPPMAGGAFFAPVVNAFRQRYPKVELQLVEDGAQAIESRVRTGQLEIGVAVLPVDPAAFSSISCIRDRLCLVAPAGSRWQGRAGVRLKEFADQPMILYPEDFTLSHRVADAYRKLGKPVKIAGRSAHWDLIVALVAAGLGLALLPERVIRSVDRNLFDIVPLDDESLVWHLGLIWKQDTYLSHAARAWLELTRELLGAGRPAPQPGETA